MDKNAIKRRDLGDWEKLRFAGRGWALESPAQGHPAGVQGQGLEVDYGDHTPWGSGLKAERET